MRERRHRRKAAALYLLLVVFTGCAGEGDRSSTTENPGEPQGGSVDYATQIQPIFDANCSCHLSVSAPEGAVLLPGASYDTLVGVPSVQVPSLNLVEPGEPDRSYLLVKVDDGVPDASSVRVGDKMPPGLPPLKASEIRTLRQWIAEGAAREARPDETGDDVPPEFNGPNIAVAVSDTIIEVFWDPATDNVTPPERLSYHVFVSTESGAQNLERPTVIVPFGGTTIAISGLQPIERYFVMVRAVDEAGNQDENSVEVSARTLQPPFEPESFDFDADVAPIFRRHCTRCHGGFENDTCSGVKGMCLESYPAVEATAIVRSLIVPFASDESELFKRIADDSLPRMPFDGPPFLDVEEIATIQAWIDAGARPTVVIPDNRAPVADPAGSYTGVVGKPVQFSGSASFDPDGDPIRFMWSFGDSTSGVGEMPSHVYSAPGEYLIALVVSDGERFSEPRTTTCVIEEQDRFPTSPTLDRICTHCHGVRIILLDGKRSEITPPGAGKNAFPAGFFTNCRVRSAQAWESTIRRMREQNGAVMTDSEAEEVISFLVANYSDPGPGGTPGAASETQETQETPHPHQVFVDHCGTCHAPDLLLELRRSPYDWQMTVDRMIRRYEVEVSAADRDTIIKHLSIEARAEPPATLSGVTAHAHVNLVCSSCHSPARFIDERTGRPHRRYRNREAALELAAREIARGVGVPGITDSLVADWLVSVGSVSGPTTPLVPDMVSIDRFEWRPEAGTLTVHAWSSAGPQVKLTLSGEGDLEEPLTWDGTKFVLQLTDITTPPGRMTLHSSLGGRLTWHRK